MPLDELKRVTRFDYLVGQERAIGLLTGALKTGEIPHAWLFSGPAGVGKRSAAEIFARALFCQEPGPEKGEPCGACRNCHRIDGGGFPDYFFVEPVIHENRKRKEITIKDIKELIAKLSYKPYEADRKVVVIDGVDAMNLEAANAFLKTLEEPPPQTIIIMIAVNRASLPPTILSRCQEVRFGPLSATRMANFLMERLSLPEEEAKLMAALSRGSPGFALGGGLEEEREIRDGAWRIITGEDDFNGPGLFTYATRLDKSPDRELPTRVLQAVISLLRDLMTLKIEGKCDKLINVDLEKDLTRHARRISRRRLLNGYRMACSLVEARELNISPILLFHLLSLELFDRVSS